ncbi:MAG: ATP-binding protein [Candidatus Competibacteraceae bacterium]|nr:ATP-binding protein [Candidatus Competibacteraceae bacterium]
MKNFEKLAPVARLTYLKRVCIFGPESTGKSTLSKNLAQHFQTRFVPEYARTFMEQRKPPGAPGPGDFCSRHGRF